MSGLLTTCRIMLAVLVAVVLCGSSVHGQTIPQDQLPQSADGPSRQQFNAVVGRLEGEIRSLRQQQSGQTPSAVTDPTDRSSVQPAGYGETCCDDEACETCNGVCPDCSKPVCEGMPHLCGVCLEQLGWNKASGWRIVPFGRLRAEAIYSTEPQTGDAVIVLLNPRNPDIDEDQATIHAKQSQLNFLLTGPPVGQFQTGGLFMMNFMGAQPLRNFSGANIVLAYGELKNEDWRFSFGRMLDLFGPIQPATVNQLQQRGAGDIGIYRGALNIDRYITVSDRVKWTLSARASQQDISDYGAVPGVRGKDNGWPNIEARVGVELGPACDYGRPMEVGISGVIGETQAVADPVFNQGIFFPAIDEIEQTRGVALDFQLKGPKFGFRSEVWWGQAAGTYFVATLQSLNPETAQSIESVGGWGEIYWNVNPCVTMHVGYGIDDPRNGDLGFLDPVNGVGQVSYNDVGWWNAIWNVTDYFALEFEVSHRRTNYLVSEANNTGTLFHFASTLKF